MKAYELWACGYQHVSCMAKQPATPEHMAHLRNTLGPDALRAESFYVHPSTGKAFGCASVFLHDKAECWPVDPMPQPQPVTS